MKSLLSNFDPHDRCENKLRIKSCSDRKRRGKQRKLKLKRETRDKETTEGDNKKQKRESVEYLVLGVMNNLDYINSNHSFKIPRILKAMKEVSNVLQTMMDFLKKQKLGERRRRRINYFICDIVDITENAIEINDRSSLNLHILSLLNWVKESNIRMHKSGVDGIQAESTITMRSEDKENVVVGLEEDVELLLRGAIFNDEKGGHSVSLITGMPGIGKTALARQIFNHPGVVDRFQHRACVCVSTDLSHKEVLMKLIQQVVDCDEESQRDSLLEKLECADNPTLQDMLRQRLQGVPYFIVLDDVPKQMHLQSIFRALPDEDKGSRLLLTSRTKNVQATLTYIHEMKILGSDKSWQLFSKTIFSGDDSTSDQQKFPKHLEDKGKAILTKCGGLPLAIKEMGRKLAKERQSGGEWEQLFESIDLGATLELLEIFYQNLDPKLKSCFLHLAFFKENTTLRAKRLVQIWAAGKMLPKFQTKSYLDRLHSESIIEVKDTSTYDKIKSCRINAILHRVSIRKAEELISFEILRSDREIRPSKGRPRHRVISCSREKFNYSTNQDKHLVSLFFHGGAYFDNNQSYWERFEQLRILDLEDFGLQILPEAIGALIKLRYLGLRNNYIKELPHSLSCLKKLEVLDISLNFMVEVPDTIWEMRSLRHLYMSDVICWKPLKVGVLQNLQTLTYISVDNWTYELSGLEMMSSLRKLGIEELDGNSDISKLFASLAELQDLEKLILRGFRFKRMPSLDELGSLQGITKLKLDGALVSLPRAENFPPNLCYLKLADTCLDEDPMPTLGKLPKLKCLKLRNAYTGKHIVILHIEFRNLQVLFIEELWHLRSVQVGEGAMQVLNKLEINNCPYLEALPEEIGSMPNLELTMVTAKSIATKIRK